MKNQVQLICYANRLGSGGIAGLAELLRGPLSGLFGGVHLLPFFYPVDGADAGFDPIDHLQVDEQVGDWPAVRALGAEFELMADVIVNHISVDSPQFKEFSRRGMSSRYHGLFLSSEAFFPNGASGSDLAAIYRPRPGPPFTHLICENGEHRELWTTFTSKQIDIDVNHPVGRAYLEQIVDTLAENQVRVIRLDAVGYAVKRAGTSCFMLPETFDFIDGLSQYARARGLETLVEVHSHFRLQQQIAVHADFVYDFALPPLVLHALSFKTAVHLKEWARIRPPNAFTVLDTHDGIGVIDIGPERHDPDRHPGLVPDEELTQLVETIHHNSKNQSRKATGASASNLDLYQINCTFYDALGRDDDNYILARAIQFFLPGIPQVYYVGLLAGENDMQLLRRTGVGRDINRHFFSERDIELALDRPVVRRLFELIRIRNSHAAFSGSFELLPSDPSALKLKWTHGLDKASLYVDFLSGSFTLDFSNETSTAPTTIDCLS